MKTYVKDPNSTLDYSIDWSLWLVDDTIVSSTWNVDDGITLETSDFSTYKTTVWLSGGTEGNIYTITNTIETSNGRIDERSFYINIKNR